MLISWGSKLTAWRVISVWNETEVGAELSSLNLLCPRNVIVLFMQTSDRPWGCQRKFELSSKSLHGNGFTSIHGREVISGFWAVVYTKLIFNSWPSYQRLIRRFVFFFLGSGVKIALINAPFHIAHNTTQTHIPFGMTYVVCSSYFAQ